MKNNVTLIVLKKELLDIFRDKKTLIIGILIPIIIFPVIFGVMGRSMDNTTKSVENNLKIAVKDDGNSSLSKFIKSQKNIKVVDSSNIDEDVKNGKIYVGMEIPKDFDKDIQQEKDINVNITYDNVSQQSSEAMNIINSYIDQYSKVVVKTRLDKRNINTNILTPVTIQSKTSAKEKDSQGKMVISLMLPLLLIIYSVSGPIAPATDLGAGEKERGTLEPLLTTQAGRLSLLWGKFLAITIMGAITTAASLTGLFIAMSQKNGIFSGVSVQFPLKAVLLIALVSVLITMVFGALELAISIYARSFKEAQTYLSPLMIVAFIPAYGTYMLDAKSIDPMYFHIPLANASCLIKELVSGIYNVQHMFITFGWIAVYVLASILFARYMFSREDVIFRT
ncbi:ABC transporter permease [Clostridium sp. JN-9]|uniref:ABC transporter permease n=1 Tax=Clostridium sp. JN-9 TaxID=2507159 RepID=UPI000FFE1C2D|nr:ABC transporter permease [Clostridium sp. JN-9]QAT40899.1 ABC transporter permease [Clostridium sp. JN-9]